MSYKKYRYLGSSIFTLVLGGCSDLELLSPKGTIGEHEKSLILLSMGIMLCVVIPVVGLSMFFAWRYRASNRNATYAPTWAHSTGVEVVVWSIPIVVISFLGWTIWRTTHELDPYKPLVAGRPAVEVDVVALNWKWLFIYPEYGVATVNTLSIPVDRPINFHLTSDSMMNSFFIPQLGSQVYAMAGMETQLHLMGTVPGTYMGRSTAFSGPGFSGMQFPTHVLTDDQFAAWLQTAHASSATLDGDAYLGLRKDSEDNPEALYGHVAPHLFGDITTQYDCRMQNSLRRVGDVTRCDVHAAVMENQ